MTQFIKNAGWLSLGQLGISLLALVFASSASAELPAVLEAQPGADSMARLCEGHGYGCDCPGCRAYFDACQMPCPPVTCPEHELGPVPSFPETLPSDGAPLAPGVDAGAVATLSGPAPTLSAGLGAVATASGSPSMIGDFFGGGYNYAQGSVAQGATVAVAGGDRMLKFADNNSPLPQDRVFLNYHHFHNALVDVNGDNQDANRFTFGLERTFWDGAASIEFRIPFTAAVDADQEVGEADTTAAEFGNLALALKGLLYRQGPWSIGAGLAMIFPTADDSSVFVGGAPVATFTNEAYYLQPFVGVYCRPDNYWFSQFVTQVSFDATRNEITVFDGAFFGGAAGSDRLREQTLLFLDYSVGRWVYRSRKRSDMLTGIAPMVELHYTSSLTPLDLPDFNPGVFEQDFRRDVLNITGGVYFEFWRNTGLKVAGVAPLRDGTDRIFDAEFGLQLIHRY